MAEHTDTTERDALVTSHLPLVGHLVREAMARVPGHVVRDDLVSAGQVALVQAARSFDAGRGVPFARYASLRIRGAVIDELRSADWATRSVRRVARDVEGSRARLGSTLGRTPTDQEIAADLGITVGDVEQNAGDTVRAQVLSIQGVQDAALDDVLPAAGPLPEEEVELREQLTYLVEAVAELPDRLRAVVAEYYLDERPMAQIAAELGVTESRVSQMRAEALVLLRGALSRAFAPAGSTYARPRGAAARRREAYFTAVADRHAAPRRRAAARSLRPSPVPVDLPGRNRP